MTFVLPKLGLCMALWWDSTTCTPSARPMAKDSSSASISPSDSSRMCVAYTAPQALSGRATSMISWVLALAAVG